VLNSDDPRQSCGIGALSVEGVGANALTDHLERKYRIHVRPRVVEGELDCIRVTPNVFTTLEEVDLFAEAIEDISRRGLA
jgi:selenocysteine lyase/cysteine desulfurase